MNKTRRRLGRARRNKARLLHEIHNWTKTNYTAPPRRGRLRLPVLRLLALLAPVLAFAAAFGAPPPIGTTDPKGSAA